VNANSALELNCYYYYYYYYYYLLQQEGRRCKEKGIQLYQTHSYNQAIVSLGLAKEFIPRSMAESQGQVQSYLASCHFSLHQYPEALEAGKEAYKIRPGRALVCMKCIIIHSKYYPVSD